MPYPTSVNAMRKYYNPAWGRPLPDGATGPRKFKVEVSYSYRGSDVSTIEVEAWSEEEAREIAAEKVEENADLSWDAEIDIDDCRILSGSAQ